MTEPETTTTSNQQARYSSFVKGLDLKSITLIALSFKRSDDENDRLISSPLEIKVENKYKYAQESDDLKIRCTYTFLGGEGKNKIFKFEVTYELVYVSLSELDDDLINIYCEISLPLNIWPYVREHVQSTMSRAGFPPLTLPLYKGLRKPED